MQAYHLRRMAVGELDHSEGVVDAFAAAVERVSHSATIDEALGEITGAAAAAVGAELAVLRVLDPDGFLRARAVRGASRALAAELEGSRYPLTASEAVEHALAAAVDRTAARLGAESGFVVPVLHDSRTIGSLELYRVRRALDVDEQRVARLAAGQAALVVRAFGAPNGAGGATSVRGALDLAGDALAAGLEHARTADQICRLAAEEIGRAHV